MTANNGGRKALFFTTDAILASTLIFFGILIISVFYSFSPDVNNIMFKSTDLAVLLSSTKASQLNLSSLSSAVSLGYVKNSSLNESILEVIGDLWTSNNSNKMDIARLIAEELINATVEKSAERMGAGIYFNGEEIYSYSPENISENSSTHLVSAFRLISGIEEYKPKEGYSSIAILSSISSKIQPSYAYFGGFVGQGNITQFIILPSNYTKITEAYLEFSTESNFSSIGNNFSLSINGTSIGNLNCSGGGFMRSTNCYINSSYFSYFQPGINILKISFQNLSTAYVSGGFFRVKTETPDLNYSDVYYDSQLNTASKTEYFPGVDSVINIYSSFYAPGNITSMELFLNYTTAPPLFVNIGGFVVYYSTKNGSVSVLLNNSNLSSSFNYSYSAISNTTVPIKIGHYALEQITNITGGNADVILITDVSGSMAWQIGDYTANNTYNWTSADLETGIKRFNTSATLNTYNTGFVNPTATYVVAGSAWTNASNVTKIDGKFAQQNGNKINVMGVNITNTIPTGATIVGIQVRILANASSGSDTNQIYVAVSNDSGTTWSAYGTQTTGDMSTTNTNYTFGNSAYLWGLGWNSVNGANNLKLGMNGSDSSTYYTRIDWATANVTYTNYVPTAEQNSPAVNYPATGTVGVNYQVVTAVKAIITIDSYNPAASNTTYANNKRPDLQVAFYNGAGYGAYSNCSVNASMGNNALNTIDWNCIISASDAATIAAWNNRNNRKIQVRAINLDAYNNLIYDEINVSAVYLNVSGYNINFSSADNNGNIVPCNDSPDYVYPNDTSKISLAKCLDKQFIDIIMNSSGNRLWLVDFSDSANSYYSTSLTELKNEVDSYNPNGGTCICCAINKAYNLLNSNSNSSRNKYVLVMSDGITGYRCTSSGLCSSSYQGTLTTGSYCCDGSSVDCSNSACNGSIFNANYSSYRVHTSMNATVYAVGFGPLGSCYNANRTLVMVAQSGNGSVYVSGNTTELFNIYRQIATSIVNQSLVYKNQTVSIIGVNSTLYPNSYLRINYTPSSPPFVFGKISITLESQPFGNNITSGTLEIPAGVSVSDAKVTSYSSFYWTHNLTVNSVRVFNLSDFGNNYSSLGDPFLVSIPLSALHSGNNPIIISVGTSSTNDFGGSPDDRIIYTLLINNSISYSAVAPSSQGCSWNVTFSDGTNATLKVPANYNGTKSCVFSTPANSSFDSSDAISASVYNLFQRLDLNGDGKLEVNINNQSLLVETVVIGKVPSMWGPAKVEIRVWK